MRKDSNIDQITVNMDNFNIQFRRRINVFDDDDALLVSQYKYIDRTPADDVSGDPGPVRKVANALWTPAIIAAAIAARDGVVTP